VTKDYRAYVVSRDGHILSRTDLLCFGEKEAKERASQMVNGSDVELWRGTRRIAIFKAGFGDPA